MPFVPYFLFSFLPFSPTLLSLLSTPKQMLATLPRTTPWARWSPGRDANTFRSPTVITCTVSDRLWWCCGNVSKCLREAVVNVPSMEVFNVHTITSELNCIGIERMLIDLYCIGSSWCCLYTNFFLPPSLGTEIVQRVLESTLTTHVNGKKATAPAEMVLTPLDSRNFASQGE